MVSVPPTLTWYIGDSCSNVMVGGRGVPSSSLLQEKFNIMQPTNTIK